MSPGHTVLSGSRILDQEPGLNARFPELLGHWDCHVWVKAHPPHSYCLCV